MSNEKKDNFPDESEIVLCTVTNIQYNSVFVKLDEYENLQGMIHISEISPGRIRNLRDYVKEGKVIVCKILKIHKGKGHIDLSLRRVNENQRRLKLDSIKRKQKAEKIVEFTANEIKADKEKLLKDINNSALEQFNTLYDCFESVIENNYDLNNLKLEKKLTDKLLEQIKQKIKPSTVSVGGTIKLTSYEIDGIKKVKDALIKGEKTDKSVDITYEGAGKFKINVIAKEYKTAEKILETALDNIESEIKKDKGTFEFQKKETKK